MSCLIFFKSLILDDFEGFNWTPDGYDGEKNKIQVLRGMNE